MAKTYLGYGYTNENGVATLDFDAEDNPLPKKSYQCHSRTASVVAEASVNNVVTSSENIRFCEGYVPPTESLTLTADKNILSYADNDTVTLTATYDGTTLEGKSVVFKIGSRVLDTVTTDSEGVAEYEYSSQGMGDIVFTAECGELQETYSIEDCYFYDTLTTDKQLFSIATGSGTLTYSNDGLTFRDSTSSETKVLFDKQLPTSDYEVSYDIVAYGNTNNKPQVCFEDFFLGINNSGYYGRRVSTSGNLWGETGSSTPPHTIRHNITGTSSKMVETYQNNTLLGTATSINQTRVMQIFGYENGRSITFTNLKIKPLPFDGSLSISANKDILSYVDEDECVLTATLTGDNVANRPVVFKNGNTVLDTVNTNSNGVATYTYSSQGVGDVTFTVECMNLQETYELEDCFAYRETGSQTHNTGSTQHFYPLFDLTNIGDYEITGEISATTSKGFSIGFNKPTDWTDDNFARCMVDGAGYEGSYCKVNGNLQYANYPTQYTANTYFAFKFKYLNGVLTLTHKNRDWTPQVPLEPCTFGFGGWNSDKTINYRNLKIKPL